MIFTRELLPSICRIKGNWPSHAAIFHMAAVKVPLRSCVIPGTRHHLFAFVRIEARGSAMKQVFEQFLKFLHDGIAAIFRFVELIWTWSVDQISKLASVPWQQWPLWKEVLLLLILVAVVWALYRAGRELLTAGAAILGAFADLLGVLVRTLPHVMLAGIIALGGVWVINHLDNSLVVRMPTWLQASQQSGPPQSRSEER